jgi:uncharacterized protein YceK
MRVSFRTTPVLILASLCAGCTSMMVQQQGKHTASRYPECPVYFNATRMESASLEWAFSDSKKPPDACLARFYPKADKDPFYRDSNQALIPLYVLSLPVDALVDTVSLPMVAATAQ